jgi:mycothiol synthase
MRNGEILPGGYSVRAATWDDLQGVLAMADVYDLATWGDSDATEEWLRETWTMPEVDLARDTRLVETDDGRVVGYLWLLARDEHRMLNGDGYVHPEHRGRGIGSRLLDAADAWSAKHLADAPPDGSVLIHFAVAQPDEGGHRLFEARGYRMTRHFWRMDLRLDGPIEEPTFPGEIEVRTFDRDRDARALHAAIGEAFAEHWGFATRSYEDWERHRLDDPEFDPSLWYLALDGAEIAGFMLGGIEPDRGWVHSLGVRKPWRSRGIAKGLLRVAFRMFAERGLPDVSLDVDAANQTGATELYRGVGMHVARYYDVYELTLRAG